ncbi:hypothetical protein K466DRAFT_600062 [Polyporus arcularius HHB13444]|uniref:Serine/threonine-protein kinase Tel1 n=1 Tax=Polyporus arcularius HHB13444 TaxID=1314778 RepID=A0A5C3PAJ7_9APHY|nr:hypothetical protein K466DRAFT_600062 [Polyporus arcularius HHB13444]
MSRREPINLAHTLDNLTSDKATERQHGRDAVRNTFERASVVLRFDSKGNGKPWLALFQALFTSFSKELKACISKTGVLPTETAGRGSAALKRLGDVASVIRWLTEQSIERLNSLVLKSLLIHLTRAIVYQGELLAPVALDYAKTINLIVAYKPHLYALKDDMWHDLLALAFNTVVGLGPRRKLAEDLDGEGEGAARDSDVELNEALSDESDRGEGPSTPKLKRPRRDIHLSPRRRATVTRTSQPVTLEQIEFMSVVSILLCSPVAPLLAGPDNGTERTREDPDRFPRILLSYFTRFLRIYTGDTSLHHDFLIALSAALSHLTLNCRQLVKWFANDNWEALVSMWGMKNQSLKGHLVVILRQLFPYLLVDPLDSEPSVEAGAIAALWNALEASAHSRGSVPALSLESLRLRLFDPQVEDQAAFTTQTFASGWHFDPDQALSWAVLELQADCAEQLYLRLESTYSSATPSAKRIKLENPVPSLLLSIRSPVSPQARMHHLQVLLFLIDRHWSAFYDQLRQDIIAALVPLVSLEDSIIQSWTLLCLAAVAHAECAIVSGSTAEPSSLDVASIWDPIWTHAMRRANVPAVSRAACHAAHILLAHSGRLLSSHRVLQEIESFTKDLDVQGPGFPYDSVCDFLVLCLRIANQDVRLYRMQMEEKVLSWLVESWRFRDERRTSMPLHTVADVHALLEGIVSSSKRVRPRCDTTLPHSIVVNAMVEERQTKVIRDFQLYAHLPPYRPEWHITASPTSSPVPVIPHSSAMPVTFGDSTDLAPPRGRERRLSAFLLKSLEEASLTLASREVGYGSPTAERIRCSMDLAVSALLFEGSLLMNGTQSNRRVLQAACKLLGSVTPLLTDRRWSPHERRLMLDALDPLIRAEDSCLEFVEWQTLVPPNERTGIKSQVLRELLRSSTRMDRSDVSLRRALQRFVFRSTDVQDAFTGLLDQLRSVLRMAVGRSPDEEDSDVQGQIDDADGFGPVRSKHSADSITRDFEKDVAHVRRIVNTCITALAVVPILQSSSGEATRDRALTELVLNSSPDEFLLLAPSFCDQISCRTLNISETKLEELFGKLIDICEPYPYKNRIDTKLLVVRILEATSHVWMQPTFPMLLGDTVRGYCWETVKLLRAQSRKSWQVQDAIIRFLDGYLAKDPEQTVWQTPIENNSPNFEDLPSEVLPALGRDDDIRIRFRIAAISPRLFVVGTGVRTKDMNTIYKQVHSQLSVNTEHYEGILTRLLCLGNIAISEASMRRGAYWHLLEIASYCSTYHPHLKAVLKGVVDRLGLESFADLFDCHASQFAFSIRQSHMDLFKFPPDLLGYRDRRECAEATFRAFTPTNLLADGGSDESTSYGKELFVRHCQAIQRSEQEGIVRCFAELVSYQISLSVHSNEPENVEEVMMKKLNCEKPFFREQLKRNIDEIVASILRSLGDQDISQNGPVASAIASSGSDTAVGTFRTITQYRSLDTFQTYSPNLPAYSTSIILQSLEWFRGRVKRVDSPAVTYHILHHLFADIERTPLVNEQYRLLNGLCLWIACHDDHFQEESLLRTLLHRSVSMLAQADLARGAQSLLEWCLSQYKASSTQADYRLTDVLIRISTIAHDFSQTVGDEAVVSLGADLLAWAETQAAILCKGKSKRQVMRALAAWPRELPAPLQAACEEAKLSDLTAVLVDHGVSASKFRLVRKIRDLASQHDAEEHFSTSDFWRLKACIPPPNYLVDSDINAFTSLLMMHCGQLDSIAGDRYEPETVRTAHRRAVEPRIKPHLEYPPRVDEHLARACVVTSLRSMMDNSSASRVHVAYQTLRTLLSVSPDSNFSRGCPTQIRRELQYLQAFSRPFVRKVAPDLRLTLTSEAMMHLSKDFSAWISRISTLLCDLLGTREPFFGPLTPVLQSDYGFAEEVLPVLVHALLQIEFDASSSHNPDSIRTILSEYFSAILSFEDAATPCYRAIISVVLHLRYFNPSRTPTPRDALAHDRWLAMDFTLLSRCAIKCNAYTTALLFLELASDHRAAANESNASATEHILFEIYSHIDEPDGFYGIQTEDLRTFFVKRLRHESQWDKALRYHGAVVESGAASSSDTEGVVQALYSFGFNQLALNTMQNFSVEPQSATTESSSLAYNLGWRAETWDLPENLGNNLSGSTLYLALRAVYRERSPHVVDMVLRRAFVEEMNRLRELGSENFTEIRQVTQNLMCLSQIRQWRTEEIQKDLQSRRISSAEWGNFSSLDSGFDFANMEAIMATRISLVRSMRQKEQRDQIGDLTSPFCNSLVELEKTCLLCLSEKARDVNQPQIALNSVVRAQNLERSPSSRVAQEFASVLWLMSEPKLAIKSLSSLAAVISLDKARHDAEQGMQHALLLARLGTWSAEASMQKPSQIVSDCFGPAAELVLSKDMENAGDDRASIFHQYAIFAERQYHAIMRSPDALRWKLYVDRKKEEIKQRKDQITRLQKNGKDVQPLRHELNKAQALLKQDEDRYREQSGQRTSFLALAAEMYARCLAASSNFDEDSPIRLCSLWLANFDNDDPKLNLGSSIALVPSHKFVFLAHQLTARLSKSDSSSSSPNQVALQHVIQRMGLEHPYHSLFPLYCLRLDTSPSQASSHARRQSGRHASPAPSQLDRAAAVTDLFDRLRSDQNAGERVRAVERVCDASLQWAKYPIKALCKKSPPGDIPVPDNLQIRELQNVPVPVITASTPIDPTLQYRDCVWIAGYDDKFSTAGGVNLPKIIKCFGSDGKPYKQLFKGEGEDDLRQDAVMEQVFDLVNVVLRHDRETRKRKLSVRGYKVIPLAAQAGVLEFVDNTTPLASWIRPAHTRYNPDDYTHDQFKEILAGPGKAEWRDKPEAVIRRFIELRAKYRPVMRHYFTEKHKTPMSWFAMRLHYSRSVATTSIVGHILGLGDRHTSNILMDNKTGEVVHIDLGIAFEQGKLLPQPERVPFRLTADMVDGFGISGTQGVFQRCAEETLRVLRDGSETILTVLEVFKYDPLHSWTASEFKIKRAQGDETAPFTGEAMRFAIGIDMASGTTDEAADRALSAVARKLDKTLSVEYTVNELITEASDPANLALMYIGWAPHW